jgi:hypothetical protein
MVQGRFFDWFIVYALVYVLLHIAPLHIPLKTIVQNFIVEMISMLRKLVQRTS